VLSTISGVWGIAALVGPMVGGAFAELGWWRGAFWMAIPVVMVVMGLIWHALPSEDLEGKAPHVSLLHLLLLGMGVLCVAWSGHVAPLGMRLVLIGSAGVWVVLAFRGDARAAHRLFPSQPLALTTPVGTGFWIVFLFGVTSSQVSVYLPLVVQILHGVSPLGAGYFYVLRSLAWTVAALCTSGPGGPSRAPHDPAGGAGGDVWCRGPSARGGRWAAGPPGGLCDADRGRVWAVLRPP
jgi:hypothetical protein